MKFAINVLIVLFISILTVMKGATFPLHNWDMIGYTASLYHYDGFRGEELNEKTFADIKKEVSEEMFKSLTTGHFRQTVYLDPISLEQQIPFYQIRPLYLTMVKALSFSVGSYAKGTYIISALFSGLIVLMLALIFYTLKISVFWLFLVVPLSGILSLTSISTPDALSAFFMMFIFYLVIRFLKPYNAQLKKNYPLIAIIIIISLLPFVRTDLAIFSVLFSIVFYIYTQQKIYLFSLLCSLLSYYLINTISGNYGYLTIFNFTLIATDPYPATLAISNNIQDYLNAYFRGISSISSQPILWLTCLFIYLKTKPLKLSRWRSINAHSINRCITGFNKIELLTLIAVLYVACHFLLFPAAFERNYLASLLLLLTFHLFVFKKIKDKA